MDNFQNQSFRLGKKAAASAFAFLVAGFAATDAQANLINNGGFETGSFSSWTYTPATIGPNCSVQNGTPSDTGSHTGSYYANFGQTYQGGTFDSISQSVATTAGEIYAVDLWLENPGGGNSEMRVSWNGNTIYDQTNQVFGWTEFKFNEPATSASSSLAIAGYQNRLYFHADDVSVVDTGTSVPEPASAGIAALCTLGLLRRSRRVRT